MKPQLHIRPLSLLLPLAIGWVAWGATPRSVEAQVPEEAIREIRSLTIGVDLSGGGASSSLRAPLEAVVRESLTRAGILADLPDPRARECCELRLDVRIVNGQARGPDRRGLQAFAIQLELGLPDRLGRLDTWVVLWRGRVMDDLVESPDLEAQLRFAARELADEFVDGYLAVFPIR